MNLEELIDSKRALADQYRSAIEASFQALFDEYPELVEIWWLQYRSGIEGTLSIGQLHVRTKDMDVREDQLVRKKPFERPRFEKAGLIPAWKRKTDGGVWEAVSSMLPTGADEILYDVFWDAIIRAYRNEDGSVAFDRHDYIPSD